MRSRARITAVCGILTALAIGLSALERMLPLSAVMPLPFVKIGLANIVTLFALLELGRTPALIVVVLRTSLAGVLFGGPVSFIYSFCGAISSYLIMAALKEKTGKQISCYGLSVCGAAANGVGQVAAASLLLGSVSAFAFLPALLFISVPAGILTALCYRLTSRYLPKGFSAR